MTENEKLLTEDEAAQLLNVSSKTLRNWRSTGRGPAYSKLPSIRYKMSNLSDFVDSSEISPANPPIPAGGENHDGRI